MDAAERAKCIEEIQKRTGLSAEEADALLREAGDDVIEAILMHERRRAERKEDARRARWERVVGSGGQKAFEWVKEVVREGNQTRLIVRRADRLLADIPLTAGIIGTVLSPGLALVAAATCLFTGCRIDFDREERQPPVDPPAGNGMDSSGA
ncbi:MAG TPA: DUF4342 domain-containing protein [Limnochordia bacterium]